MKFQRYALLLVALLMLAACGASDDTAADTEADAASEPAAVASEAAPQASEPAPATSEPAGTASQDAAGAGTVAVASSEFGDILVDGEGVTLYVFDNDEPGTSNCEGDCAANWPPLTGDVSAGDGVDDSLLGTTERGDGTTQVTYADSPLYYFAGDQAAGDVNGQAVGDIWWVVGPDGEKITESVSAADASSSDDGGY